MVDRTEDMQFIKYRETESGIVAVFKAKVVKEHDPRPLFAGPREQVYDQESLADRLVNLQARDLPHDVTAGVLAGWPKPKERV